MNCETLKVGDRIWIGEHSSNRSAGLRRVKKLTPTQVVVDAASYEIRFKKEDGYEVGSGMFKKRITAVATPAECKAYDDTNAAKDAEDKRQEAAMQALEKRRQELYAMFTQKNIGISPTRTGTEKSTELLTADRWTVTMYGLTSRQCDTLALFLQGLE